MANYLCNMSVGKFEKGKVYDDNSINNAGLSHREKDNFQLIEKKQLTKDEVEALKNMKQKLVNSNTIVTKS